MYNYNTNYFIWGIKSYRNGSVCVPDRVSIKTYSEHTQIVKQTAPLGIFEVYDDYLQTTVPPEVGDTISICLLSGTCDGSDENFVSIAYITYDGVYVLGGE